MSNNERVELWVNCLDYSVSETPKIGYEKRYTRLYGLHSEDCDIAVHYVKHGEKYSHNELLNAVMLHGAETGKFAPSSLYFDARKRPCKCKKRVDIDGNIQSTFLPD